MRNFGYVDLEGGPLLLADLEVARAWRGIENGGYDYKRGCEALRGSAGGVAIDVGESFAVLWSTDGPGTVHVFGHDGVVTCVRPWLADPDDTQAVETIAGTPLAANRQFGRLTIFSGALAILWSAEDGRCIESATVPEDGRPTGEMAIETGGLMIHLRVGSYSCIADRVSTKYGDATRCHLIYAPRA